MQNYGYKMSHVEYVWKSGWKELLEKLQCGVQYHHDTYAARKARRARIARYCFELRS